MKLLHVPQKLADLVRLGLALIILKVQRTGNQRMLKNVVTTFDPIQPVPKSLGNFAKFFETNISRAS